MKLKRVGIYAGAFNPVHVGHVAFALQALKTAKLDAVYFLPERQPRHKSGVEHFAHRVAMLRQAAQPHPRFGVLELPDIAFTPERTLPKLRQRFGSAQFVFLLGSDVVSHLADWPKVEGLLHGCELVVGLRGSSTRQSVERHLLRLPVQPKNLIIFPSHAASVSSGTVREALQRRQHVQGLLSSVRRYSDRHWLYVSLA